jgi:hypothetical protein
MALEHARERLAARLVPRQLDDEVLGQSSGSQTAIAPVVSP